MELTQKEKIENQKEAIRYLYCEKGESISGIGRHLKLNRKELGLKIHEWNFKQKKVYRMTHKNKKLLSQHRDFIISQLNKDMNASDICKQLNLNYCTFYLFVATDKKIKKARDNRNKRLKEKASLRKEKLKEPHKFEPIAGEIWKPILGYTDYHVSNMGRFKKYLHKTNDYKLLTPCVGSRTGKEYISLINNNHKTKNLSVSRLVAFAFCNGHSKEKNIVDHIDNNPLNNKASNLQWCTQSENNKFAYQRGRRKNRCNPHDMKRKFIVDDKYEFKTVAALAKFINKSETQTRRYLSKELDCPDHTIKQIDLSK